MANCTVVHPVVRRDALLNIVAVHAIGHFRQRQAGEVRAGGDTVVAGGAIEVISFAPLEMLRVRELDLIIFAGDDERSQLTVNGSGAGTLNLFYAMTALAIRGC